MYVKLREIELHYNNIHTHIYIYYEYIYIYFALPTYSEIHILHILHTYFVAHRSAAACCCLTFLWFLTDINRKIQAEIQTKTQQINLEEVFIGIEEETTHQKRR